MECRSLYSISVMSNKEKHIPEFILIPELTISFSFITWQLFSWLCICTSHFIEKAEGINIVTNIIDNYCIFSLLMIFCLFFGQHLAALGLLCAGESPLVGSGTIWGAGVRIWVGLVQSICPTYDTISLITAHNFLK